MQKLPKLKPIPSPPSTMWKEFRMAWMTKVAFVIALLLVFLLWRNHIYVPIEVIPTMPSVTAEAK